MIYADEMTGMRGGGPKRSRDKKMHGTMCAICETVPRSVAAGIYGPILKFKKLEVGLSDEDSAL